MGRQRLHGLNASGRSPAAWTPDRFRGRSGMPELGWDSVTVPGAVSAWVALAERFGRLPLATLAEPAIRYARHGFMVSPIIAELWRRAEERLAGQPGFAEAFLPGGRAPAAGELFRHRRRRRASSSSPRRGAKPSTAAPWPRGSWPTRGRTAAP